MRWRSIPIAALLLLGACARLPENYESLQLAQKVRAYEDYFAKTGSHNLRAVNGIVDHGAPAAEAMIPYLRGEDDGLPRFEAARIV